MIEAIENQITLIAQTTSQPLAPSPTPTPELPWYDKIIFDPVNLISISLAVIAVILGVIPLFLYIAEKRKSRLLDETVREFSLLVKIREMQAEQTKRSELSEAKAQELAKVAKSMQDDVEQRIPKAAMTAYYENTIPQLELQILDLGIRLSTMKSSLNSIQGASSAVVNPQLQRILSEEISKNVGAKRTLEQLQILLIICTSITSAILALVPYPFSVVVAVPATVLTIVVCARLFLAAKLVFPDNRLLNTKWNRPLFLLSAFTVLLLLLVVIFYAYIRQLNRYE
jgi:hypothetical protein